MKKITEESEEVNTFSKWSTTWMYLYGDDFLKGKTLLWCVIGETIASTNAVWKKEGKLGFNIPDMGETIPIGEHVCKIQASING